MIDPTSERANFAAASVASLGELEVSLPRPGVAAVALKGEHDLSTAPELGALLQTLVADHPTVLVDVTEAEFIDSTVIQTLVLADRQARAGTTASFWWQERDRSSAPRCGSAA